MTEALVRRATPYVCRSPNESTTSEIRRQGAPGVSLNNELGQFQSTAFEEYVAELMEKTRAPGVAVGIAVKGQTAYFRGFGMADVEKNVPVGEHTVFGLASVTKSFTALAINQLAERGRLSKRACAEYLPEFNFPWKEQPGRSYPQLPPTPRYASAPVTTMCRSVEHSGRRGSVPDGCLPRLPATPLSGITRTY